LSPQETNPSTLQGYDEFTPPGMIAYLPWKESMSPLCYNTIYLGKD